MEKHISTDILKTAIEGATSGVAEIFENQIEEYGKKKKSITNFRDSLYEFINKTNENKPLVFIIDELDRCRPNYAVSILEQIKHFFLVKKIIFVLSIDKVQLGNAVRGVYGSDRIDADEYLRRFIDLEYSIPEPKADIFSQYLYDNLRFDDFFQSAERLKFSELRSDKEHFLTICKILFTNTTVSLRQQEKIFSLSRLALRSFQENHYVIPDVFLFLSYLKIVHFPFYEKLKQKQLTILDLQTEFKSIVDSLGDLSSTRNLMWLEAYLITYYNNYYFEFSRNNNKLLQYDDLSKKNKLQITSVIDKTQEELFLGIFESLHHARGTGDISLEHFLNKLDLLESLT